MVKKVLKSKIFRETVRFGLKLILTEKVLKEHKSLGKVVKYI